MHAVLAGEGELISHVNDVWTPRVARIGFGNMCKEICFALGVFPGIRRVGTSNLEHNVLPGAMAG
jgi:hypothetical protein